MGECLITRRGGESYELPVLNANYPQDVNLTVIKGDTASATFNVSIETAGKPAEYTYQWYVNGSAVSGATGASYTKSGLSSSAIYSVYCEIVNKAGVVTSRVATLKVEQHYTPVLNSDYPVDASKTYTTGNTASQTFEVKISTAGSPSSYTYQWYVNNSAVSGATGSSYTWNGTEGTYSVYCKVTNAAGSVDSRTANLNVVRYYTPTLNDNYPSDVTVVQSSSASATFKAEITAAGVPSSYTYQWYVNGSIVNGETSSTYTKSGLSSVGTYTVYCKVTSSAGSVDSRTATLTVVSSQPSYTYSGNASLVNDGDNNYRIKFLSSGNLTFTNLGCMANGIDIFCVGGGGGGAADRGGGGAGGKTATAKAMTLSTGTTYTITVGSGGGVWSGTGGTSSFKSGSTSFCSADGGGGGDYAGGNGGSGGGGAGHTTADEEWEGATPKNAGTGGNNGGNGGAGYYGKGTGQGTTTREFGETSGDLYAGGGGGGPTYGTYGGWGAGGAGGGGGSSSNGDNQDGTTNTGGGGQGRGGAGGSGIVVIRNKR